MTIKRLKKWKGDSHTHIILKYYSHRRMVDNDGEPAVPNDPRLNTKRKRHYHMKEQERGLEWYRFEMHKRLHPEKPYTPTLPVQTIEATPGKPQSKGNQRRREKRARRRAEKRV